MTTFKSIASATRRSSSRVLGSLVLAIAATGLTACSSGFEQVGHVGAFSTIDPLQRHPILVSEEPASLSLRVPRGSDGLTPHQRANVSDFLSRYRGSDTGNGRIAITVPSGTPNEIAALRAVADLRAIVRDYGIDDTRVAVTPSRTGHGDAAIRVSYTRFVAHAPECGIWPINVGNDPANLPHPNFGCSTQRNFAMQVANPADLLGPRTMTPATAERRDVRWEKFLKGETTTAKKDQDERASTKSEN